MVQLFHYVIKRLVDFVFRVRKLSYILIGSGVTLLVAVLNPGFVAAGIELLAQKFGVAITLSNAPPQALQILVSVLGAILVVVGLVVVFFDFRIASRKRVYVVEVRGLQGWTGTPLIESVPASMVGQREEVLVDLRNGGAKGKLDNPSRSMQRIVGLEDQLTDQERSRGRADVSYLVGGLAPVPLNFLLGVVLDDESGNVTFVDWERYEKRWRELDDLDDGKRFVIEGLEGVPQGAHDVVVAVSASYDADEGAISSEFGNVPIVRLKLEGRSASCHWSRSKQEAISRQFHEVLMKLASIEVGKVHLILVAASSVVIRLGSHYDRRLLPSVIVYQYEPSSDLKYPWGIQMPTRDSDIPTLVDRAAKT